MLEIPRILKELGWNKRPLDYDDFEWACDKLGVEILRANTETPGMYFVRHGKPFIGLSARIYGVRLWHVAFHELTHHLLHAPGLRCFSPRSVSKAEAEAEAVSICSVIDDATLYRILAEGELHDFPRRMVQLRMEALKAYKV